MISLQEYWESGDKVHNDTTTTKTSSDMHYVR